VPEVMDPTFYRSPAASESPGRTGRPVPAASRPGLDERHPVTSGFLPSFKVPRRQPTGNKDRGGSEGSVRQ
jgi:hypothetical protein